MIDTGITLQKVNSPYLVTSDLVISPDGTITIEPGVDIRFADGAKLEVRGTLLANGTLTDSITFTSNTSTTQGSWIGIDIRNSQGGNATFRFCEFRYAQGAIIEECCHGAQNSIDRSSFISNITAIGGYTGHPTHVDSCYFSQNVKAIISADKEITYCVFENNDYGLASTERTNVSNSSFKNHSQVALMGRGGIISDCTIEENNVGIKGTYEGFTIRKQVASVPRVGVGRCHGGRPTVGSNVRWRRIRG